MTTDKHDWDGVFTAIEEAMASAANQHSAEFAASEAERHGLIKQGDASGTYQDKVWEMIDGGVVLRLRWHSYDPSHAYRVLPDMNVLSLELMRDGQALGRAVCRFEDYVLPSTGRPPRRPS